MKDCHKIDFVAILWPVAEIWQPMWLQRGMIVLHFRFYVGCTLQYKCTIATSKHRLRCALLYQTFLDALENPSVLKNL
jgi:hypothetical protein